jgi:hypothetical protein
MNPSFREILELLNKYEVEYIVVGGVAAVIKLLEEALRHRRQKD